MKKSEKILLAITIIIVILGGVFIYKVNEAEKTKLVEKLDIYINEKEIGKTVLGAYKWNNPTNSIFQKNYSMNSVPANILLESGLEINVKKNDVLEFRINKNMYQIKEYKIKEEYNVTYIDKNGKMAKEENLKLQDGKIKVIIPNLTGIHYMTLKIDYSGKGTVYNYVKINIK